jgi:bacillithiol biosynthesis deacetylase BshB1
LLFKALKLDILVFAAHPDDAELSAFGTLARHIHAGRKVGIIDMTRGELGTRGTPEIRMEESKNAGEIIGVHVRENLGFRDAFFSNDEDHIRAIITKIRQYRPELILGNAILDRHPDHGRAAEIIKRAFFLSGLAKIETTVEGKKQEAWRPSNLYNFIQSQSIVPDMVVDVSDFWAAKMEAIRAYRSQFFDPESKEPETYISSPEFMHMIEARGKELGHAIGVKYGEGFTTNRYLGVKDLFDLL